MNIRNTTKMRLLGEHLRKIRANKISDQAMSLMKIGCTVHDSFFDRMESQPYTKDEVTEALSELGIKVYDYPGSKWYQFWHNEMDDFKIRMNHAINAIKI